MKDLLHLHVLWHPSSPVGKEYGERLFRFFQRGPDHPLIRGLGIAVHFWSESAPPSRVPPVPSLDAADHNGIVIVWDDALIWTAMSARGDMDRIFFIVCREGTIEKLPANFQSIQALRVDEESTAEARTRKVMLHISVV